jgi:acetolactate synthase-1/2/3 large subunit
MVKQTGATLLVRCLEQRGIEYIFGIPGAKIDSVFDALLDSSIKLIVCRHEQNAAFMAAAYGRLTGKPGIVLVTSGPGVANLTTGLLTATTEGDPVIALGGNVPLSMTWKQSHQNLNNVQLMQPVTKSSVEARAVENIPELIENAFLIATEPTQGACFISLPQDILREATLNTPLPVTQSISYGQSTPHLIAQVASRINDAKQPVLFLGSEASRPENTAAIRQFLDITPLVVVSTYQAAGVIAFSQLDCFMGRVGLFKNQPGDRLLDEADLIITIGYNPVEYDPEIWNTNNKAIIHVNYTPCKMRVKYTPIYELLGDIDLLLKELSKQIKPRTLNETSKEIAQLHHEFINIMSSKQQCTTMPIHPLRFIHELTQVVTLDTTVCCDVGSVYMWMARYFLSYRPHQLLFSNGQQTLGIALPWAIAAYFARPKTPIISISGDGGFLFSAMELETAVREQIPLIHFIWRDGSYNMVLEQEMMKYHRKSGVDIGKIDIPLFAQAFGAVGYELKDPNDFQTIFKQALHAKKPVLIDVPIDYSDNLSLFQLSDPDEGH